GTGWTNVVGGTTMAETNGTALFWGGNEYQIVSSVAAVTGTWTETPNSGHWTCAIAVYKAAPSGYSPPAVFPGVFNLDARRMI
ncbi:MAG: hypothetical protein J2P17_29380, partial [Mycobacterium sp.]|nr:hypothetical protein [Mycobacterium sp.]